MKTLRVILVEDNDDDAELILRNLRKAEYDVEYARVDSAAGVRSKLGENDWDIVISDYGMRDFNGLDALEILQDSGLDIPFIIISGSIGEETAASLMRHGVSDYLMKDNLSRLAPAIAREMQEAENRREKRDAERALAESEERLKLALSAAGMGAWEWDLKTDDFFWSPEASAILGMTVAGTKATDFQRLIIDEDREVAVERYSQAMKRRNSFKIRVRIKRGDGDEVWIAQSGKCEYDEAGNAVRMVGTIRDITRDKRAEDALLEAEEKYRMMADSAADAVISIDETSTILYTNPAVNRIFGFDSNELLGQELTMLMPERLRQAHLNGLERHISDSSRDMNLGSLETVGLTKDGREIAIQISFGHHRKDGKHFFTGFIRDVSEAKAAEEALVDSEKKFKALVQATTKFVWRLDEKANLTEYPYWWEELTGQDFADSRNYGWVEYIHPDDQETVKAEYINALETKTSITLDVRIRTKSGEHRYYSASGVPIPTSKGTEWICALSDMTAQKSAELAVKEREERLRTILETEPECIKVLSPEGEIQDMNRAGLEIVGAESREDVMGRPAATFLHPEYVPGFKDTLERVMNGSSVEFSYEVTGLKGTRKWLEMHAVPLRSPNGEITSVLGVSRDITEKKKIELSLIVSESRFSDLINSISGIVWEADDPTLNVSFVSRVAETILGYPLEEWYKPGFWKDHLHPDDRERVVRESAIGRASGESFVLEYRMMAADGNVLWFRDSISIVSQAGGSTKIRGLMVDITELRQKDADIQRKAMLIEQAHEAIFVWSTERGIIEWNKGCEKHYGFTREEALGRVNHDLLKTKFPVAREEFYDELLRTRHWSGEVVHTKKDGTTVIMDSRLQVMDHDGGTIVLQTSRDVTDQRSAETALKESEARYRHLFENSPYPMWVYDVDDHSFLAVNDAAAAGYGYVINDFASMSIFDLHPTDDRTEVEERLASSRSAKDVSFITRHRKRDGTEIIVEINSHAMSFKGRRARIVLAHDITEQVRSRKALERSEEKYRDLFENANDIIYTHDLDGKFTSINLAGLRVTGYTEEEALKLNLSDVVVPEFLERAQTMIQRKVDGSPPTIYETEVIAKDGRRVPLEINTRLLIEDGIPIGVQGIGRDISERRAAEAALRSSEEQLRQSQKLESIGILAGGMAHDFNNMLTAINGYSDLILRKLAADDPIRKNVEEIRKAGDRSAELTRQLLAFSRRQILQPRLLDLNEIITETASMLERLIGKNIRLEMRLESSLGKVEADPSQLSQVLVNLVINSRDAMPNGGKLTIETRTIDLDEKYAGKHVSVSPGRYVLLAVSDNGTGMDEATKSRVFEPFFTTKGAGRGTGLGLSTVYGIIKQSGGNIWVYSEPGKGTSFKIYLPATDSSEGHLIKENSQRDLQLGSETILLAEDEDAVRSLAVEILEGCGYTVISTSNGIDALEKYQENNGSIDLLITDIVMPEMGGRELSEILMKDAPDLRVLFTSGYTDDAILRNGFIDEANNFLQKPFTFDALSKKVRELLDS